MSTWREKYYSNQQTTQQATSPAFQRAQQNNQGILERPLNQSGLYDIPFLGGLLGRGIVEPLAKGAEVVGQAIAGPNQQIMSPQDYQNLTGGNAQHALQYGVGQGLSSGLAAAGGASLPGLAKGLITAPGALMMHLMPNRAGQAIEAAGNAATKTGITDTGANVLTEARQAVEDKFAPKGIQHADSALKNAFGKMAQHVTGIDYEPSTFANMEDFKTIGGELTPNDLIKARQTIVARYGYNPENGNIDQKVANIFRDILSKRAKDLTPGLTSADKAYQTTQAVQNALPTLLRYLGIPAAAGAGFNIFNTLKRDGESQP